MLVLKSTERCGMPMRNRTHSGLSIMLRQIRNQPLVGEVVEVVLEVVLALLVAVLLYHLAALHLLAYDLP